MGQHDVGKRMDFVEKLGGVSARAVQPVPIRYRRGASKEELYA